jgi:hypothetical protein
VRGHRLLLILGVCGLLLTPNAGGGPSIPGDPTPPVVTPHIFGTLGLNGWYVTNVTVNWTVEDPESVILETRGCDAVTLTSDTVGTPFSCYARSDGGETTVTITIRLDKTGPIVTATPSRAPDSNGWYNHALSVSYSGTDATSGIDSCVSPQSYSGPDNANASVSGSCVDRAGNTTQRSFSLSYDATAPQVTGATPSRGTDHNGWYNHTLSIAFAGSDATSGIDTCTQTSYSGPDSRTASVSGTCRDRAGNLSTAGSFTFQYDETGPTVTATPSRSPDSNGWYNHALSVSFAGSDATSGIDSCVPPQGYSGPDSASASVSGSCVDRAGNTTVRSFGLSYDATGPAVTATPSRTPDSNGWYNHVLTVSFSGTDATSGIDSCVSPQSYSGPDSPSASVSGSCRDRAGNTTVRSFGLSYDSTGPTVTATPARAPDSNGWYNHALAVSFAGSDATSGVESCVPPQTYSGPDDESASVSGSCRDRAGNTTAQAFGLSYDSTGPIVTATPSRAPDSNGWYNHALSVSYSGTDATSGIDSCVSAQGYSGPDNANASVSGSCVDRAGNSTARAFGLSYDATAPQVTGATPSRGTDHNGWYNHTLSIAFAGSDATSGIDTCTQTSYSGPDSRTASVPGTCRDRAGNLSTAGSFTFQYDETGPTVTATPSRSPDSNGWYNHSLTVSFTGTDPVSTIESCVPAQGYSGPDNGNASVSGSCVDRAGNTTVRSFGLSYDATAPQVTGASASRSPDRNGWYNHDLTVSFGGTDAMSGIQSCAQPTYSGPDSANASVSGTCLDRAGNQSASSAFGFMYDETGPVVTATPARAPDSNGWYNHALSVTYSGTDATSGIDSCVSAQGYSGPDNANASVSGSCADRAGNTSVRSFGLSYDATAPHVSGAPERGPDGNGWYNHPLRVTTEGADPTSGINACTPPQLYSGPDDENALVSGNCSDRAGNAGAGSIALRYDATAPVVTTTPARASDSNGWYNHPLTVSFSGTDARSGIESCVTPQTYSGPDSANASVSGSCSDRAGNATPAGFVLKYDATGPAIAMLVAKPGKRSAELHWRVSADAVSVELMRAGGDGATESVIYQGRASSTSSLDRGLKAGRTYRYRLTAADEAANRATRTIEFVARGALLNPAPGERVSKPPLLVWAPVKGASYYNVILVRGRRVFSAWPVRARLQLRRTWKYRGHRYKLRRGLYRWYVWPGRGKLSAGNYGRMLGGSTFVVSG